MDNLKVGRITKSGDEELKALIAAKVEETNLLSCSTDRDTKAFNDFIFMLMQKYGRKRINALIADLT